MSRFVESIKILNGRYYNLKGHQLRMLETQKHFYGQSHFIDLRKYINIPENFKKGLLKCRIEYDTNICNVALTPYSIRTIRNAKLVVDNAVNYPFKSVERSKLDELFAQRGPCDEIIIIKNAMVTDAYFYNVVFEKNGKYYTPALPLLKGTQRQILLDKQILIPTEIRVIDIKNYQRIHFINALTKLGQCTISVSNVTY